MVWKFLRDMVNDGFRYDGRKAGFSNTGERRAELGSRGKILGENSVEKVVCVNLWYWAKVFQSRIMGGFEPPARIAIF